MFVVRLGEWGWGRRPAASTDVSGHLPAQPTAAHGPGEKLVAALQESTPNRRRIALQMARDGGTVIDVALAVIIMAQWYAATGRPLARQRPAAPDAPVIASRPASTPQPSWGKQPIRQSPSR